MVSYRRSPAVDTSKVGDRIVLYHRESEQSLVLNPTGARVWELLAGPTTEHALSAELARMYPKLEQEQADQDVANYLQELLSQGVVLADE